MKKILIVVTIAAMAMAGCKHGHREQAVEVPSAEPPIMVKLLEVPQTPIEEKIQFRVTAYCPCEICCGEWARRRPTDENGEPIVYGAQGVELVDGVSCASPLAFGTEIELDGIGTVKVQDRTANWVVEKHGEHIIDLYMTDHETAWNFEVQYVEGVIK